MPRSRLGKILWDLVTTTLGDSCGDSLRVLDCACGIGTQAIGLALAASDRAVDAPPPTLGSVVGTDLSPAAVERARVEAARLVGADEAEQLFSWAACSFTDLEAGVDGVFEVVMAADNALPHLLTAKGLALTCLPFVTPPPFSLFVWWWVAVIFSNRRHGTHTRHTHTTHTQHTRHTHTL